MKISLISQNRLNKKSLSSVIGGTEPEVLCDCICIGDNGCADCGASNAHRVLNRKTTGETEKGV